MDEGIRFLNGMLDSLWLLEQRASAASGKAQDRYESGLIDEARAIATGDLDQAPTSEHLRVLIERLDSATLAQDDGEEAPF